MTIIYTDEAVRLVKTGEYWNLSAKDQKRVQSILKVKPVADYENWVPTYKKLFRKE